MCNNNDFMVKAETLAYFHDNTYYISTANLENYGFDLIRNDTDIFLIRNANKNIELAPKNLINRKKDDELFQNIYPAFENHQSVFIDNELISSLSMNEQICIDINSLSDYAIITFNENDRTIKLDYKKKEFNNHIENKILKTIEYTGILFRNNSLTIAKKGGIWYNDRIEKKRVGSEKRCETWE